MDASVKPEGLKGYVPPSVGEQAKPYSDPRDIPYVAAMDAEEEGEEEEEEGDASDSSSSSDALSASSSSSSSS